MIVTKKEDGTDYYGAVQFDEYEAKKTLMNYPGVELKYLAMDWRFCLDDAMIGDGDWLVTNKTGETEVYNPEDFKEKFTECGGDSNEAS